MKQLLITILLSMLLVLPAYSQQAAQDDEWAEEENSGMTYDNVYIQVGKRKKADTNDESSTQKSEQEQIEEVDEWAEEENSGMTYDNVYIQVGKRKKADEKEEDEK